MTLCIVKLLIVLGMCKVCSCKSVLKSSRLQPTLSLWLHSLHQLQITIRAASPHHLRAQLPLIVSFKVNMNVMLSNLSNKHAGGKANCSEMVLNRVKIYNICLIAF